VRKDTLTHGHAAQHAHTFGVVNRKSKHRREAESEVQHVEVRGERRHYDGARHRRTGRHPLSLAGMRAGAAGMRAGIACVGARPDILAPLQARDALT
jgi:hypothetical protein